MSLISWQSSYSVGIEKVDNQHQKLIQNINDLFEAMSVGKGREVIAKVLINLTEYTKEHFSAEEAFLILNKYPQLQEHRIEHLLFINKLNSFKLKLDKGDLHLSGEVIEFLKTWFIDHICTSDKKYAEFIKYKS